MIFSSYHKELKTKMIIYDCEGVQKVQKLQFDFLNLSLIFFFALPRTIQKKLDDFALVRKI